MTTCCKIYYVQLPKLDVSATLNVDRRLRETTAWHKFRGDSYWLLAYPLEPRVPNALPVNDCFICDNEDDFLDAAADAGFNECGAYIEYKQLAVQNELYGALEKRRTLHKRVRREFLESMKGDLVQFEKKLDALYQGEEFSTFSLVSLGVDLDGIVNRGKLKNDRNPKILRTLMFHQHAVTAQKGRLDGIKESHWKAHQTLDNYLWLDVYDELDSLRGKIRWRTQLLENDLRYIDQKRSETPTLVNLCTPSIPDGQLLENTNDYLGEDQGTELVSPLYAEEKVVGSHLESRLVCSDPAKNKEQALVKM
ncbi:uncharacterized protein GIQ15_03641 [Arthroderma uncinatum]|uniref:uncharacterized protein n=1 Tax=Arthroderma uncinatum TaxID=74035 RepID=UPI00144AC347|nr:uncharacterized protein GIQ15_03641 [Arthroderma uncinatum]KAF3484317.1 hypothetical protein GIQ15_03641 [Arthroderma uncinatum]